jgi:DNA-binding transcriptional regulator YiaG
MKVVNALTAVIEAAELATQDALHLLLVTGEKLPVDQKDQNAAFERVRLRSLGVVEEVRDMEGGGLSDAEFAARLGVSARETVRNYREKGRIFAWEKDARNLRYPAWQIHDGGLLPGLTEVLAALTKHGRSAFAIANYFLSESEELGGKRPLDLLRAKRAEEVKAHAERYGSIGA